jgi:hypothetical protein
MKFSTDDDGWVAPRPGQRRHGITAGFQLEGVHLVCLIHHLFLLVAHTGLHEISYNRNFICFFIIFEIAANVQYESAGCVPM